MWKKINQFYFLNQKNKNILYNIMKTSFNSGCGLCSKSTDYNMVGGSSKKTVMKRVMKHNNNTKLDDMKKNGMKHNNTKHNNNKLDYMKKNGMEHHNMKHHMEHHNMKHHNMEHHMEHHNMKHQGMEHKGMEHKGMKHKGMKTKGMKTGMKPNMKKVVLNKSNKSNNMLGTANKNMMHIKLLKEKTGLTKNNNYGHYGGMPLDYYSPRVLNTFSAESGVGVETAYGASDPTTVGMGNLAPFTVSENAPQLTMMQTGGKKKSRKSVGGCCGNKTNMRKRVGGSDSTTISNAGLTNTVSELNSKINAVAQKFSQLTNAMGSTSSGGYKRLSQNMSKKKSKKN